MNAGKIKNIILAVDNAFQRNKVYFNYKKNISIKKLTRVQKKEIKKYYKENFGINVTTREHELIYSICGVYKKEFMPFAVYGKLLETLSPYSYKKILDDKAIYDWLFPDIKFPERIISCCNGVAYCYDSNNRRKEVTEEELLDCIANVKQCIIKPSVASSAGIGVKSISNEAGIVENLGITTKELIKSYNGNFVIERKVLNNQQLKVLNPSSCNTFRIHTWRNRSKATIEFVSAFLRVGREGAIVDNAFAGGICVPIGIDGLLLNSGCTFRPYKRIERTDSGVVLKGLKIDNFEKIVDTATKAHSNLPYFDFIGWDFTFDEEGDVVMIEYNADPDMRLDQLIFLDTCLGNKQYDILKAVYNCNKK